ncbi:unnamed protein product [Penicillium salamii]|uniref:Uncharacterized protein n=1 Tax=Penicillium salamii TaxID=1612424 RepID=A0A9W4I4H1_9EURO|nr:unnamed protein product [Penicillium salamii]
MPSIDMTKVETAMFLRQIVNQVGLLSIETWMRCGYAILGDLEFTASLLSSVYDAVERMKENWNLIYGFDSLIYIVLKTLSLSTLRENHRRCFEYLSSMRQTIFQWVQSVRKKANQEIEDARKVDLVAKAVHIALVCVKTFDMENLMKSFALSLDVFIFLQCCMIIWNGRYCLSLGSGLLLYILYYRCATWSKLSLDLRYWLYSVHSLSSQADIQMYVHYNLLTGELLVDGLPLARLSAEYEYDDAYQTLFGRSQLEVMLSYQPGMQFLFQAVRDDQVWNFVPQDIFLGHLLDAFVTDYVHWYAAEKGYVEFRPLGAPWVSSERHWRLIWSDSEHSWCLKSQEYQLVGSTSETAKALAKVFDPLEKASKIYGRFDEKQSTLCIDLPRLRLEFTLPQQSSSIQCRQYPGMMIDARPACNSLVGLHNKLFLVNTDSRHHVVLISEGDLSCSRAGDHVHINVVWQPAAQIHAYSIDKRLGCFGDNGSLQSKLFIAYLHVLTLYFLPDPLTGRIGTDAIFTKIAALTSQRGFYPDNERVMQNVEWTHTFGCLSQHSAFYDEVVAIRDQNLRVLFYYPGEEPSIPSLPKVDYRLLLRDRIRSFSFRTSGFGAEDHIGKYDCHYISRDTNRSSLSSARAFIVSKMLWDEISRTQELLLVEWVSHLWSFLSTSGEIRGLGAQVESANLRYSVEWMKSSRDFIVKNWCAIHQLLLSQERRVDKYQLIVWLSTIAYLAQADIIVLKTIASLYLNPRILCEYTTIRGNFQSADGFEWVGETIGTLIEFAQLDLTLEDELEPTAYETYSRFQSRVKKLRQ